MKRAHRVHEEDGAGGSADNAVSILIARELKAEGIGHAPLQTHRMGEDHEPGGPQEHSEPTHSVRVCVLLTWLQPAGTH